MTRQQGPLRRMLGRTVLALAATAAALALFAPPAIADPQSDAAGAIDAAWTAAGGDGSPLGTKDGDVYPVGTGFAQNFAGGAVFFTPETGARIMTGAILDKYRSLGGPADSDLGFPNIDEGPGRVSPDSRNSTFSAPDQPVIFWTPASGAWVVRGSINAAWDALGGSAGVLGVPTADESQDGDVATQTFTGGQISYDSRTQKFTTEPPELAGQLVDVVVPGGGATAINDAYRAAGGPEGPLGPRAGDQYPIGSDGIGQNFAGGKIFYSPTVGAFAVSGAILEKYESAGGPTGDIGFPNSGEADGGVPGSRLSSFAAPDNPVIFWTEANGAVVVRGPMKAAWDKLGGAPGALGVPVADQTGDQDTVSQKFSGGQVNYDVKSNKFSTEPPNLAESLGGLAVPTPVPGTPVLPAPEAKKDNTFAFHTWWLWWIIPLALLVLASLAVLLITSARRRRASSADAQSQYDEPAELEAGQSYGAATDHDSWPDTAGGHDADHDADPDDSAYLASRQSWPEPATGTSPWSDTAESADDTGTVANALFTHHGRHQVDAEDDDEDTDAVDTAPTRVQSEDAVEAPTGRHAAVSDPERSTWYVPQEPPAGSLNESAYGEPAQPRAEVMAPDIHPDEPDDDLYAGYRTEAGRNDAAADREDGLDDADDADVDVAPVAEPDVSELAELPADVPIATPPAIHLPLEDPYEAPAGYPVKGSMSRGTYLTPDSAEYADTVAEIWFASADHAQANGFTAADH